MIKLFVFALLAGVLAIEEKPVAEIITESTIWETNSISVKGSYSYLTPEGEEYQITFTADDKGYKPTLRVVPAHQ
ncbi:hypothetical protein HW555_007243 [Spodoptera exigua]|uniref:Uncharacterized protein n=1 Tax=Spodoptera exigua TaxID=7107 RepID=A0A835L2T8_SPOEX|nr:hypothetical protein HW555_007243 [Spodoptera exigua]